LVLVWASSAIAASASTRPASATGTTRCFAPAPIPEIDEHYVTYREGCRGHDEVSFAPLSTTANTASDITWNLILPADGTRTGAREVIDLAPVFWVGAGVADSHSLFGQAFLELQFYPDTKLVSPYCKPNGDYQAVHAPNTFAACAPVWAINPSGPQQYAAFNGLVKQAGTNTPLVMHGEDNIRVRMFKGAQTGTPWNIAVTDLTTGAKSAPLVVISGTDGPLAPLSGTNTPPNFIKWMLMQQPPLQIAWEIGHPNIYTVPEALYCLPGQFNCWSYNVQGGWEHTHPLRVRSVKFNNGTVSPANFSVSDAQGGIAEDRVWCGAFNAPGSQGFCTFPWYSYNATTRDVQFGGTYPGTSQTYGKATQFPTKPSCVGGSKYCAHILVPRPPLP
jgi:hypothetical protein